MEQSEKEKQQAVTDKSVAVWFTSAIIILLLLVGSMFLPSAPANAGLLDSFMTSDWQTRNVDVKYNLEMYGFDARAYEFTPVANPAYTCIFVASNKSSGLACFPKAK